MNPIIHLYTTTITFLALLAMMSSYAFTATAAGTTTAKGFPHPVLSPIATSTQEPTYESLRQAQTQLNANASSVHSNSGGGRFGHLVLTMPPAEFALLPNIVAFIPPPCPPDHPVHPPNATQPQITEINRLHKATQQIFRTYDDLDKDLKTQLIAATPLCYIDALSHDTLGFTNVTCLAILTHLWSTYGTITQAELDENEVRMKTPWSPPTPVETLFTQLTKARKFATAGGDQHNDIVYVRAGYNIVYNNGLFAEACREWRAKPPAQWTMPNFTAHFKAADKDRRLTTTVASAGYHGANAAVVPTPKTSNASRPSTATTNTDTSARSYCWTHGSIKNLKHSSETCKNKAEGHKDEATSDNKLGGSTKVWAGREKA